VKFTKLLQTITPHRSTLILVVVILLADSVAALAQPWIAGKLTTALLDQEGLNFEVIQLILLAWLGLVAAKSLLSFCSSYLIGSTGVKMAARLRKRVYEHMQMLPISYFHQRRAGESLSLLSTDAGVISNFVTSTLVSLLPLLLTFFGAFYMMTRLDGQVAMLAVLLLPFYFLVMKIIGRKIRPVSNDWVHSWSRMVSFVEENLGMLPVIKSFNREPLEWSIGECRPAVAAVDWHPSYRQRRARYRQPGQPVVVCDADDAPHFRPGQCVWAGSEHARGGRKAGDILWRAGGAARYRPAPAAKCQGQYTF
jgi:ABC-type multidrug transport system fused ATPase/permease subunit